MKANEVEEGSEVFCHQRGLGYVAKVTTRTMKVEFKCSTVTYNFKKAATLQHLELKFLTQ